MPSEPMTEKVLLVHDRLCAEYGCPIAYFHELDPLSELVSSLNRSPLQLHSPSEHHGAWTVVRC